MPLKNVRLGLDLCFIFKLPNEQVYCTKCSFKLKLFGF